MKSSNLIDYSRPTNSDFALGESQQRLLAASPASRFKLHSIHICMPDIIAVTKFVDTRGALSAFFMTMTPS